MSTTEPPNGSTTNEKKETKNNNTMNNINQLTESPGPTGAPIDTKGKDLVVLPEGAVLTEGLIQFYERNTGDVVKAPGWAQLTPKEREKWVLKYDEYIKEVNKENESGPGLCVHSAIEYAKSIDTPDKFTVLPETGHELLAKRNQELKAENAQLKEQISLVMGISGQRKEQIDRLTKDVYNITNGYNQREREYEKLLEDFDHCIDIAWGIIANSHGGDWDNATADWVKAAESWLDTYLPETSRRNAERAKQKTPNPNCACENPDSISYYNTCPARDYLAGSNDRHFYGDGEYQERLVKENEEELKKFHESGDQPNNDLEVQWYNRIAGWLEQGATISATNKTLPVMKGEEGNLTIIFPRHESGDLAQDPQLTEDYPPAKPGWFQPFYFELTKILFPESDDPSGMPPSETIGYFKQHWGHYKALCREFDSRRLTEDTDARGWPAVKEQQLDIRFAEDLEIVLNGIQLMLIEKNEKYGDSALNPKQIFSRCDFLELINIRIDDKLSRIANRRGCDEDPEWDLIGYLILKRIAINREKIRFQPK
jgi:hypothetical protein